MTAPAAAVKSSRSAIWHSVVPLALALLFALLGLRSAGNSAPMFPDAARHALNGALIHDMVRQGGYLHPLEYTRHYYSKLPAVSIPYHPPVFPMMEAVAFWLFGVSYGMARLVVALTVFLSGLLLYRLVLTTHGSPVLAAVVVLTFFALPHVQWMSQEAMLEFPSLLFALAALLCLYLATARPQPFAFGLLFAILGGIAVWTKQQTVFLAGVPFASIVLTGRWRELGRFPLWISSAGLGLVAVGMLLLSRSVQATSTKGWTTSRTHEIAMHHLGFYGGVLLHQFGWIATSLLVGAVLFYAVRKVIGSERQVTNDFYMAWALAAVTLMLMLPPWESRYLIYAYPPLLVLLFAMLQEALATYAPSRWRGVTMVAVALIIAVPNLARPSQFVFGYNEAAEMVRASGARRVLYCGPSNGSFIFAMRVADPTLQTSVIREDKIRQMVSDPGQVEAFLHTYGVASVVVEESSPYGGCGTIQSMPPARLVLQGQVALACSNRKRCGHLRVYRFTNPSPEPRATLKLPSSIILGGIEVDMK